MADVRKRQRELYGQPFMGFGAFDDAEYAKAEKAHAIKTANVYAQEQMLDRFWNLVIEVFGKDAVDLAIEEGEQRIGSLPYVETADQQDRSREDPHFPQQSPKV